MRLAGHDDLRWSFDRLRLVVGMPQSKTKQPGTSPGMTASGSRVNVIEQQRAKQQSAWRELGDTGRLPQFILLCLGVWLHAADTLVTATIMPAVVEDIGGVAYVNWTISLYQIGSILPRPAPPPFSRPPPLPRYPLPPPSAHPLPP